MAASGSDIAPEAGAPGISNAVGSLSASRAREANLSRLADVIRTCIWSAVDTPGWGSSVAVPATLLLSEVIEPVQVGAGPYRFKEPGELARVNIYGLADVPHANILKRSLVRELEPFVIGVGEITIDDLPEGLIVRRRDGGGEHDSHEIIPSMSGRAGAPETTIIPTSALLEAAGRLSLSLGVGVPLADYAEAASLLFSELAIHGWSIFPPEAYIRATGDEASRPHNPGIRPAV